MRTLAVIPARYGSTRLPGKPLQYICGKPMIQHVYERVEPYVETVIVATDSELVAAEVIGFGGKAILTSSKCNSGTDRCYQAAAQYAVNMLEPYDLIINVQGDQPLIHHDHIKRVIKLFDVSEPMSITTCAHLTDTEEDLNDRSNAFVVLDNDQNALYFSRYPIPHASHCHWRKHVQYYKHIGIYGFSPLALKAFYSLKMTRLQMLEDLEQLKWLENGNKIRCSISEHPSIGVDTIEDLQKVKQIIELENGKSNDT